MFVVVFVFLVNLLYGGLLSFDVNNNKNSVTTLLAIVIFARFYFHVVGFALMAFQKRKHMRNERERSARAE